MVIFFLPRLPSAHARLEIQSSAERLGMNRYSPPRRTLKVSIPWTRRRTGFFGIVKPHRLAAIRVGRGEQELRVIVEDHEAHVMDASDLFRTAEIASQGIQQRAQPLGASRA
jgi:hypothetical protein